MKEANDTKEFRLEIENVAAKAARNKTNVAKWGLNSVIFLFALLIINIILISLEIEVNIVAAVSIIGLGIVWLTGWRRGKQLYLTFFDEELSKLYENPNEEATTLVAPLTSREVQVLSCAAQGYSNKQIGLELSISENTVKYFISNSMTKLEAYDRTHAVVVAIKRGLISI